MRVFMLLLSLLAPAGYASGQEEEDVEQEKQSKPWATIYWDEGLRIHGLYKNFTVQVGGMAQNDSAAFSARDEDEAAPGPFDGGVEWRRARIYAEGVFARFFEYKFMYDFASNNPPRLKDSWVSFSMPFAPVRLQGGRFRTRLSLEGGTSAADTTFMERGLVSAFVPVRNTGFLFHGESESLDRHLWWAVGLVQNETQFDISAVDRFGISGRFAYAWRDQESLDLLHLGVSFFNRPVKESIRFLERPESHIAGIAVDTGDIPASATNTFIAEAAAVRGAFSLQSEYAFTDVRATDAQNPAFHAFYVFGSYFLTGESRRYRSRNASFGEIRPKVPFAGIQELGGALEIAFRYSRLDLENKNVDGGVLNDLTAAFNWYASHNAKLQLNGIRAKRQGLDPFWIWQIRLQFDY